MLKHKLLGATAAAEVLAIEDVFSTYLYNGTGAALTINNGIDLAGEGGLVWIKQRTAVSWTSWTHHALFDSARGVRNILHSSTTDAEQDAGINTMNTFNNNGFTLGSDGSGFGVNKSTETYASWTFRQAPRFFDVVTYTGTGANRTIAHDLGVVPGCIIVKRTNTTGDWQVYHRSLANTEYMVLNLTAVKATGATRWNSTTPTSTVFSLGTDATVNASGGTYVAYLFAHDPLGPSGDGSDGLIACGSYTGNGSNTGPVINLGWEPQWIMIRPTSINGDWVMFDNMRGVATGGIDPTLDANNSLDELVALNLIDLTATGFNVSSSRDEVNRSASPYIYIAIRRGPMREPTSGTEVFQPAIENSTDNPRFDAPFPVDMAFQLYPTGGSSTYPRTGSRLTGNDYLVTSSTVAAATTTNMAWDYMQGFYLGIAVGTGVAHMFRRAPGFFDVVAYSGTGSLRTVSHNLGAAPDLMIIKSRNGVRTWRVYCRDLTANAELALNLTNAVSYTSANFNDTDPTDSVFTVNTNSAVNAATDNYIAYLFATLPGVSKVGSYTGNGSSQTINCGFTSGARFVLIKRTDSTGDWYVWDTARGIVAGNDPHVSLNTTAAEVTTNDSIDPDSSGFIVNQLAATNINVSSATYIYLAIA